MTEEKASSLTPAMRGVLIGVLAVIVVGVVVIVWLLSSGTGAGSDESAADASASPSATAGPLPDATPTTGSEVLAPTDPPVTTLPPIEPAAPLIPAPFPPSATKQGGLASGFPASVMGPMPDSDVVQSAVATEGDVMQVSLVGRTDASQDDVRAHYAALWASLGLRDQGPRADGSMAYTGAYESLTLGFSSSSGTGTLYSIFGVFRAG